MLSYLGYCSNHLLLHLLQTLLLFLYCLANCIFLFTTLTSLFLIRLLFGIGVLGHMLIIFLGFLNVLVLIVCFMHFSHRCWVLHVDCFSALYKMVEYDFDLFESFIKETDFGIEKAFEYVFLV